MRLVALICIAYTVLSGLNTSTFAVVKQQHPRIWLTPELKAKLVDRLNRNTPNAQELTSWCDQHINDGLSEYITSRATNLLRAINYALLYQITGDTRYAERAVQIIEYAFANPYTGYTIDSWVSFDNYYNSRYLVPAVAIVLDWCYDYMTSQRRTVFIDQLDTWASMIVNAEPWSWRDPSNNYFYGHMWGLLTTGYAIYGHHPNADNYLHEARDVMLPEGIKYASGEQVQWPTFDNYIGRAKGGMWNEGTAYGTVNNEFLCSAVLAIRSAESIEFSQFTFPNEAILFYIHALYPNNTNTYADGDGASRGGIDAKVRVPQLFCGELATGDAKKYGQYWVNQYTDRVTWSYKLYNEFLWYDDQQEALDYRPYRPDYYWDEGVQTLFWRSDWSNNACWIMLKLGLLNTDHAHNGLGHFIIYKNGYLVSDKAAETGGTMLLSDADHNTLFIRPSDDRKLYWGASQLEHFEATTDYIYLAGDLSSPYLDQPSYRNNVVEHKEREFLLLKDDLALVVMDRGKSFDAQVDKIFNVFLPSTPVPSGSGHRTTNGNYDLLVHTAWPTNAVQIPDTDGIPLLRVSTPQLVTEKTFLHVLRVVDRGGSLVAGDVQVNGANIVATAFQAKSGLLDYLVGYSNDLQGDIPSFGSFTLTYGYFSTAIRVFLMNLDPSTNFYVNNTENGGLVTITISRNPLPGGGMLASTPDGVLSFIVQPGEPPHPPERPSAPTGFNATGSDYGCAVLGWNPNPESNITGYRIYSGAQSVERGEASQYTDSVDVGNITNHNWCGLSDGTYYFALRAKNVYNLLGPLSSEESASVTNGSVQPPLPPQQVSASETSPGCVTVTWQAGGEPDIAGYYVYYDTLSVPGETSAYSDSVYAGSNTQREICDLLPKTYYFAVRTYTVSGMFSAYSVERSVRVLGPGLPKDPAALVPGQIIPDGYWANDATRPLEVRNLPLNWTVRIFNTAGFQVRGFTNGTQDGLDWTWDFTNDAGRKVARALYLVRVTDPSGNVKQSGRFLVRIDP
ncbi:MAG: hypothetical protein GTO51_06675 [Candidatus Latescibacteria bacterium]|nr:hypothetical protein [Candidatus Latescibacterota bacterium]NIM21487.1 hypothetical protein [Candidatus Latescibacterota bacterium]NIM65658.1 hypothetical protein [Candidatus Latescibacterota bacterium]NIO02040.1 hypothetical protein [Candidatus Latescibacterota bacterium]NIO28852.1 hypothetical protein [Candidatus Latescibacterota bacterium]